MITLNTCSNLKRKPLICIDLLGNETTIDIKRMKIIKVRYNIKSYIGKKMKKDFILIFPINII